MNIGSTFAASREETLNICTFNVGGKKFSFARETIEAMGSNFLSCAISRQWKEQKEVFIDADPKIFRKWIAPFIRFSTLPDLNSIENGQEKQHLIDTVTSLALTVLLDHINPPLPEMPEQIFSFGPEQWNEFYGDVGKTPALPKNLNEILNKPCPFSDGKKIHETHILFLIPETVNGKDLTINSMGELAKNPKRGNSTEYRFIWDQLKTEHGNTKVVKSTWILMFKGVLEGSRGENRETQLALAKSDMGHQAPTLLESIVCNFVHYVSTNERLLNDEPYRYTCCQEQTRGNKLVVGGFSPAGLCVSSHDFVDVYRVGVAPVLRLF